MHRFYIPPQAISGTEAAILGPDAAQVQRVLRLGIGEGLLLFDGSGAEYRAEIIALARGEVRLRILSSHHPKTEPRLRLTLAQALLKGEKLDLVLQKCTEIGVSSFIFLSTERTIPEVSQSKLTGKLARWQRIAKEAAEQSGRVLVPDISGPLSLPELLERQKALGPVLIPWEKETQPLPAAIPGIQEQNPSAVTLIVGPEGGFSEAEVSLARAHGAVSVSLGPRILRAETAAIVASALVLHSLCPSTI